MINKFQIILFIIVLIFILYDNSLVIEPNLFKYNPFTLPGPASTTDPTPAICASTGLTSIDQCKVQHDDCYNKLTGSTCNISNGSQGICTEHNHSIICSVNDNSLTTQINDDNTRYNNNIYNPTPSTNVYVIQKNGETKTHSPACTENINPVCDNLLTSAGTNITCNTDSNSCCLCNDNLWDKIYTSKINDDLAGISKSFTNLISATNSTQTTIFNNISTTGTPNKNNFNIVKLADNNKGYISNQTVNDNTRRTYSINDLPNITNYSGTAKFSPSKGYFFNDTAETIYPFDTFPNFIKSQPTNSQLDDNFYYEECLYQKNTSTPDPGSCRCNNGDLPKSTDTATRNPQCNSCSPGQISDGTTCTPCQENNKILDSSTSSCTPCLTIGANLNRIYRENNNIGQCFNVGNKTVRSDCVPKDPTISNNTCFVSYNSSTMTSGGGPYNYHLNTDTDHTLEQFYEACQPHASCKVVQNIIDSNEGYINYNSSSPPPGINTIISGSTIPSSIDSHHNMLTNELCKQNVTNCEKFKQCSLKTINNNNIITNKCLVDVNPNSYDNTSLGIQYHYIPIPATYQNDLTTDCSGRSQNDCNDDCQYLNSSCVSICSNKLENECISHPLCDWNSSDSTCSKKTEMTCQLPVLSSKYQKNPPTQTLSNNISTTLFDQYIECKGITDTGNHNDYIGEVKSFCFPTSSLQGSPVILQPTGCIESEKVNNIMLFKRDLTSIDNYSTIANNNNLDTANNLIIPQYTSSTTTPTTNVISTLPVPHLINSCRELCIENQDICDDYGVKFPISPVISPTIPQDNGCYLLKKI